MFHPLERCTKNLCLPCGVSMCFKYVTLPSLTGLKTLHWVIELSKIVELSSCQERFGAKGVQILPYFMSFPMILSIFYPYPFMLCPYYPIIDIIHILIYFIHIHLYIYIYMVFMIDVRLINLGFFPSTWHRNATFLQCSVKICSGQVIQGWFWLVDTTSNDWVYLA